MEKKTEKKSEGDLGQSDPIYVYSVHQVLTLHQPQISGARVWFLRIEHLILKLARWLQCHIFSNYSRTSVARTLIARLQRLFRNRS